MDVILSCQITTDPTVQLGLKFDNLCTVVLWFIVRRQKIAEGFGCIISIETMELVWKEDLHHKTMKTLIIYQHKISTCVKF